MSKYPLLSVIGIEIEYMLVDEETLDIRPLSDRILFELAGTQSNEILLDGIGISNELVMHVLELKNNEPSLPNASIAASFQKTIQRLQPILKKHHLRLLPTGAHPWMNPLTETERWPHDNHEIYQQYDRIFNCQGHGWANLQSMHVNLPYGNEQEFFHLHSAIRILLPLLPALAASTPFLDSKYTGMLDSRLDFYDKNQQKIPSISGQIIPEFIHSTVEYQEKILTPMYQDIAPYDPQKILQHPWLNSRGAIPKFDCQAIEIRIVDTQECVDADIAIAKTIFALLAHWLTNPDPFLKAPYSTVLLRKTYAQTLTQGLSTPIQDQNLLKQWQLPLTIKTYQDAWHTLVEQIAHKLDTRTQQILETILKQGNLSTRLLKACSETPNQARLYEVYRQLSECVLTNSLFEPDI